MPERKHTAQSALDDRAGEHAAEDAEWQRVLDVVDEQRSFGMRLDDVPVTPASKRAAHLLVLERMRRIVDGVLRLPANENAGNDTGIDDGAAADAQTRHTFDHARLLPGRHQAREDIRQLVKGEKSLRRGIDDAPGCESHGKGSLPEPRRGYNQAGVCPDRFPHALPRTD